MWQELELHWSAHHRHQSRTVSDRSAWLEGKIAPGLTRLDVTTNKVWLWGRMRIAQGEDVKSVMKLQDKFTLTPLDPSAVRKATLPPLPQTQNDELGFLTELAFALKSNTAKPVDEALFGQLSRVGYHAFPENQNAAFSPDSVTKNRQKQTAETCKLPSGQIPGSPERVKDGSCGHKRDFALLRPLAHRGVVSPTLVGLLHVIENTSFGFIDLSQDETRVAGRGRVEVRRVRQLLRLGHVVAQESFLSGTIVRRLHPRPVHLKDPVALRLLIGRGNDEERKLNLVVIGHRGMGF